MATFNHSLHTELAVTQLLEKQLDKQQILVVPLEAIKGEPRQIFDTIHHADGMSMMDGAAIFGTILMTLGTIYGFVAEWGPIIWGLIGMLSGFLLGFLIDLGLSKTRHSHSRRGKDSSELVVLVHCDEAQMEMVKGTFNDHLALGMAVIR